MRPYKPRISLLIDAIWRLLHKVREPHVHEHRADHPSGQHGDHMPRNWQPGHPEVHEPFHHFQDAVINHTDYAVSNASPFMSTSSSFLYALSHAIMRFQWPGGNRVPEARSGMEFLVIDPRSITRNHLASGNFWTTRQLEDGNQHPNLEYANDTYSRTNEWLIYGPIPAKAIMAKIPLTTLLFDLPWFHSQLHLYHITNQNSLVARGIPFLEHLGGPELQVSFFQQFKTGVRQAMYNDEEDMIRAFKRLASILTKNRVTYPEQKLSFHQLEDYFDKWIQSIKQTRVPFDPAHETLNTNDDLVYVWDYRGPKV